MDPQEDEVMDQFMEKFRSQKYQGAFTEENWEEEFEKIPMFMKTAPADIDPARAPELACLQSLLYDGTPEEQAKSYKDEGNDYFREKNYKKAVAAYSEGIRRGCGDAELSAVLYTNRAAAHFHLGNYRSSLNDAIAARKQKPQHLKALIRGALCHMELKNYSEAVTWCEEGLRLEPSEKRLLEARSKADKLQRAAERDVRKQRQAEKKRQAEREALLRAIKDRGINIVEQSKKEGDEEDEASGAGSWGLSDHVTGAHVAADERGRLHWPVLFFYPEHSQTDVISAFHEDSRFIDHLNEMFSQNLPPWDTDGKYLAPNLEIFFEDETSRSFYQVDPDHTLLQVLQHHRFAVRSWTPSFLVFVKNSTFCDKYFSDKTLRRLR